MQWRGLGDGGFGRNFFVEKMLCGMMPLYELSSFLLLCHDRRNLLSCERKLFPARWALECDCQRPQGQEKVRESLLKEQANHWKRGLCGAKKEEAKQRREGRTGVNTQGLEEKEIFQ